MESRPFNEKNKKPTESQLKTILGRAFPIYHEMISMTNTYKSEWNFSKSSGWMQKISDSKKALFYIIPLNNSFIVSLTIRENEKAIILKDESMVPIKQLIKDAKKYSEGFALKFVVTDTKSMIKILIKKIMSLR